MCIRCENRKIRGYERNMQKLKLNVSGVTEIIQEAFGLENRELFIHAQSMDQETEESV